MNELDLDGGAVVTAIDQPTVVLNDAGRVLASNEEFDALVGCVPVGETLDTVLSEFPDLLEQVVARESGIATVEAGDERQYFDVHVSEVCDADDCVGDLVLFHDVTAQQRQQRKLERQNEQLDQFASLISHDLRNPLDVAIGHTTALSDIVDDPAAAEHIEELEVAHGRIRQIIHDVLTLARQGQSIDEKSGVALASVAEDAWCHVETEGATLHVETDAAVRADRERLEQVFENLFRNSVEHGSTSNRPGADDSVEHAAAETAGVTVTVGELGSGGGFYVADDGPGIPDDVSEQVFEAGFTGDGGNTGLGLAIVCNIAEAHGWESTVTTAESGGARFEFRDVELARDERALTGK